MKYVRSLIKFSIFIILGFAIILLVASAPLAVMLGEFRENSGDTI